MQKQDKIDHLGEVLISSAVLATVTEIVHFVIVGSSLNYIVNKNWFFGAINSNYLLIILGLVFSVVIILFLLKNFSSQFAVIFLFSGAVINLLDRWQYGGAIDYIKIYHIPTFNLPDIYLTVGVVLLVLELVFDWQNSK